MDSDVLVLSCAKLERMLSGMTALWETPVGQEWLFDCDVMKKCKELLVVKKCEELLRSTVEEGQYKSGHKRQLP